MFHAHSTSTSFYYTLLSPSNFIGMILLFHRFPFTSFHSFILILHSPYYTYSSLFYSHFVPQFHSSLLHEHSRTPSSFVINFNMKKNIPFGNNITRLHYTLTSDQEQDACWDSALDGRAGAPRPSWGHIAPLHSGHCGGAMLCDIECTCTSSRCSTENDGI